jgi:hypothetical protein
LFVTTGLDPVVHAEIRLIMDCRVKPGNDEQRVTKGNVVAGRRTALLDHV